MDRRYGTEGLRRGLREPKGPATAAAAPAADAVAGTITAAAVLSATVTSEAAVAGTASVGASLSGAMVSEAAVAGSTNAAASAPAAVTSEAAVSGTTDLEASLSADVDETDEPVLPVTSGLVHHWDASSESNTVTTGEMVTLADLSASGNDGTALSGDDGGAVQAAGLNSRDYVSYNGSDESNGAASPSNLPSLTDSRTHIMVVRFPGGSGTQVGMCYGRNQTDQAWAPGMLDGSPDVLELFIFSPDDYRADDGGFDEWAIWVITHDDDNNDTVAFRYNGADSGSHSGTDVFTGATSMDLVVIGANLGEANQLVDFAEGLIYDRVLSGTEIGNVESYLSSKWGITIS